MRLIQRLFTSAVAILFGSGLAAQGITQSEYAQRRAELMRRLPDGIILLHAESAEKPESQPSFIQGSTFAYFTGLHSLPGAVLALDARSGETTLFVPPVPFAFGYKVDSVVPDPGETSARAAGVTRIVTWDSLPAALVRWTATGSTPLYYDEARRTEALGMPASMHAVNGSRTLFRESVAAVVPSARLVSAAAVIREMRFVKSPAEIAILRSNARITALALRDALHAIAPGVRQRAVEVRVASSCVSHGAVGPSFWPWTMSGPNAHVPSLVRSVYSYDQLDRAMRPGEVVRVDIGCTAQHYGADVGRTVPVSGRFSSGQREAWDLLIAAYRAGIAHMRAGMTIAAVLEASRDEIARLQPTLRTAEGRQAAAVLLGRDGMAEWSIHSVGVDSGETPLQTLADGAVVAFEPIFSVGADALYLEDMIHVTANGTEVLSAGLPYTAREIEAAMRR